MVIQRRLRQQENVVVQQQQLTTANEFHYTPSISAFNTPPLSTIRRPYNTTIFDNEKQQTTVIVVEDLESLTNNNQKQLENEYNFPILQTTDKSNLDLIHQYSSNNNNTNTSPSSTSSTTTLHYDHSTNGYLINAPSDLPTYQIINNNNNSSNNNVVVVNNNNLLNSNKLINDEFNYRQVIAAAAANNYITYDNASYPPYYQVIFFN